MPKNLFDDFDGVSPKAWKQKIQYDLKGADYNTSLVWESPEGIKVKPFYHSEDVEDIERYTRPQMSHWKIGQEIYVGHVKKANQKALNILGRGAESLVFNIPSEEVKLNELLAHVETENTSVHLNLQFLSEKFMAQWYGLPRISGANIHCNMDSIGHLARTGNWHHGFEEDLGITGKILAEAERHGFSHILGVDTALYQNAGANIVQQLAYAMAHANEYLDHFGLSSFHNFTFKVAVGSNYFFEIAKIRALRLLWRVLSKEYGVSPHCHILAVPTRRNKTLYDYNVNMLRTTTECMSAILGGADTVCNLPYDAIYHKDNEFGERMARNQLLILKKEGLFDKVGNMADGSYYIETLTGQLVEKALVLFKHIEANGGFLKQLKDHTIQRKIKESALKEQSLFDQKKEILVGTNAYENKNDRMKGELERYPFLKMEHRKTLIEPVLERRLSENMEQKRLKDE